MFDQKIIDMAHVNHLTQNIANFKSINFLNDLCELYTLTMCVINISNHND